MISANASANKIFNNFIGTNASGTNLGNTGTGIYINQGAFGNQIGKSVSRAKVSIALSNGKTRTTFTSPFGYYRFDEIEVGENCVVNVHHKTLQFSAQIITVFEATDNVNFIALE